MKDKKRGPCPRQHPLVPKRGFVYRLRCRFLRRRPMALLEARGLVKIYGKRRVVDGVSYEVNPGEVVGLLGPNGAGKTTSFRMTTGQIAPNDGQVIFNGEDVTRLPMFRRARLGMGYLTQEQSIFRK